MIVAYCRTCLPNKIITGYSERTCEANQRHNAHPYIDRNGLFPISYKEWQIVYVEGNDDQTKANIIATFGERFV